MICELGIRETVKPHYLETENTQNFLAFCNCVKCHVLLQHSLCNCYEYILSSSIVLPREVDISLNVLKAYSKATLLQNMIYVSYL